MKPCSPVPNCVVILLFVTAFAQSVSVAVELHPGDLVVIDSHNASRGQGALIRIDPSSGKQTLIATTSSLEQPTNGLLDSNGNIILVDYGIFGAGGVYRVNATTGQQSLISVGQLSHPISVAMDFAGNLILTQHGANGLMGALVKIDPATGNQTQLATGAPLSVVEDVVVESDGNYLVSNFQGSSTGSSIVRVNSTTGAMSIVASGGLLTLGPRGISLNNLHDHSILVTHNNQLLNIDTTTGVQSILSSGDVSSLYSDVTQDTSGNIFVADYQNASVRRIDPLTGVQTLVSSGGYLSSPIGIFTVIPEPSTVTLALTGNLLLIVLARRRLRNRSVRLLFHSSVPSRKLT